MAESEKNAPKFMAIQTFHSEYEEKDAVLILLPKKWWASKEWGRKWFISPSERGSCYSDCDHKNLLGEKKGIFDK